MFANEAFLDKLIASQNRAIRYYASFAACLVIFGVTVIIATFLEAGKLIPQAFSGLFGIGGAFVSSLSAFQIREILTCREKIETFELLKTHLQELEQSFYTQFDISPAQSSANESARKRIDDLLWHVVEKTALR
jgi:hypothetical protein